MPHFLVTLYIQCSWFYETNSWTATYMQTMVSCHNATDKTPMYEMALMFVFRGWGFGFGRSILYWGLQCWRFVPRRQKVYVWIICYTLCSTSRITFYSVSFCLSSWQDVSFATIHFLAETQNTVSIHRYSYIIPYYIMAAVTNLNRLWAQGPCSYKSIIVIYQIIKFSLYNSLLLCCYCFVHFYINQAFFD